MAKNISVTDALAVLADSGIVLGEEYAEAIKELTTATFMAQTVAILSGDETHTGKLVGSKGDLKPEEWATRLFDFAEDFANQFTGESKNVQGGATRMVRVVGIDTPHGHFKVELRSE